MTAVSLWFKQKFLSQHTKKKSPQKKNPDKSDFLKIKNFGLFKRHSQDNEKKT